MAEEPKFTEAEWRRREARQECSTFGHEWTIMSAAFEPILIYCERNCGAPKYKLVKHEEKEANDGPSGQESPTAS